MIPKFGSARCERTKDYVTNERKFELPDVFIFRRGFVSCLGEIPSAGSLVT